MWGEKVWGGKRGGYERGRGSRWGEEVEEVEGEVDGIEDVVGVEDATEG